MTTLTSSNYSFKLDPAKYQIPRVVVFGEKKSGSGDLVERLLSFPVNHGGTIPSIFRLRKDDSVNPHFSVRVEDENGLPLCLETPIPTKSEAAEIYKAIMERFEENKTACLAISLCGKDFSDMDLLLFPSLTNNATRDYIKEALKETLTPESVPYTYVVMVVNINHRMVDTAPFYAFGEINKGLPAGAKFSGAVVATKFDTWHKRNDETDWGAFRTLSVSSKVVLFNDPKVICTSIVTSDVSVPVWRVDISELDEREKNLFTAPGSLVAKDGLFEAQLASCSALCDHVLNFCDHFRKKHLMPFYIWRLLGALDKIAAAPTRPAAQRSHTPTSARRGRPHVTTSTSASTTTTGSAGTCPSSSSSMGSASGAAASSVPSSSSSSAVGEASSRPLSGLRGSRISSQQQPQLLQQSVTSIGGNVSGLFEETPDALEAELRRVCVYVIGDQQPASGVGLSRSGNFALRRPGTRQGGDQASLPSLIKSAVDIMKPYSVLDDIDILFALALPKVELYKKSIDVQNSKDSATSGGNLDNVSVAKRKPLAEATERKASTPTRGRSRTREAEAKNSEAAATATGGSTNRAATSVVDNVACFSTLEGEKCVFEIKAFPRYPRAYYPKTRGFQLDTIATDVSLLTWHCTVEIEGLEDSLVCVREEGSALAKGSSGDGSSNSRADFPPVLFSFVPPKVTSRPTVPHRTTKAAVVTVSVQGEVIEKEWRIEITCPPPPPPPPAPAASRKSAVAVKSDVAAKTTGRSSSSSLNNARTLRSQSSTQQTSSSHSTAASADTKRAVSKREMGATQEASKKETKVRNISNHEIERKVSSNRPRLFCSSEEKSSKAENDLGGSDRNARETCSEESDSLKLSRRYTRQTDKTQNPLAPFSIDKSSATTVSSMTMTRETGGTGGDFVIVSDSPSEHTPDKNDERKAWCFSRNSSAVTHRSALSSAIAPSKEEPKSEKTSTGPLSVASTLDLTLAPGSICSLPALLDLDVDDTSLISFIENCADDITSVAHDTVPRIIIVGETLSGKKTLLARLVGAPVPQVRDVIILYRIRWGSVSTKRVHLEGEDGEHYEERLIESEELVTEIYNDCLRGALYSDIDLDGNVKMMVVTVSGPECPNIDVLLLPSRKFDSEESVLDLLADNDDENKKDRNRTLVLVTANVSSQKQESSTLYKLAYRAHIHSFLVYTMCDKAPESNRPFPILVDSEKDFVCCAHLADDADDGDGGENEEEQLFFQQPSSKKYLNCDNASGSRYLLLTIQQFYCEYGIVNIYPRLISRIQREKDLLVESGRDGSKAFQGMKRLEEASISAFATHCDCVRGRSEESDSLKTSRRYFELLCLSAERISAMWIFQSPRAKRMVGLNYQSFSGAKAPNLYLLGVVLSGASLSEEGAWTLGKTFFVDIPIRPGLESLMISCNCLHNISAYGIRVEIRRFYRDPRKGSLAPIPVDISPGGSTLTGVNGNKELRFLCEPRISKAEMNMSEVVYYVVVKTDNGFQLCEGPKFTVNSTPDPTHHDESWAEKQFKKILGSS